MNLFKKITAAYGKPICVLLYAITAALLVYLIWVPFVVLFSLHFIEFLVIGYRVGKQNNIGLLSSFINCICFGFTWWLPIMPKKAK